MENKLEPIVPTCDQIRHATTELISCAKEHPRAKQIRLGHLPYTGKFTHDPIYDPDVQHIPTSVGDAIHNAVDPDGCENTMMDLNYIHVSLLTMDPASIMEYGYDELRRSVVTELDRIWKQCDKEKLGFYHIDFRMKLHLQKLQKVLVQPDQTPSTKVQISC